MRNPALPTRNPIFSKKAPQNANQSDLGHIFSSKKQIREV